MKIISCPPLLAEKAKETTEEKALAALDKFAAIGAGEDTPVHGDEMPEEAA